jgi:hypothetical protein
LYRDRWNIDAFGIGGDMTLQSGNGNAEIKIANTKAEPSSIVGDLIIATGGGNDQVFVGTATIFDTLPPPTTRIQGVLQIETGAGNDAVELQRIRDIDILLARLGAGMDAIKALDITADYGVLDGGADAIDVLAGDYRPAQIRNFEIPSGDNAIVVPANRFELLGKSVVVSNA